MQKRYFLVTLIDGRTLDFPFEKIFPEQFIPIVPPDHPRLLEVAVKLCQEGVIEPGTHKDRPKWNAPSQIKHIEIIFEEDGSDELKMQLARDTM